jgi:predicted transcriptional regulator
MNPESKPDELEELSLDAAARLLGIPRIAVSKLIKDDVLPSRLDKTGYRRIRRIPTAAVLAYREKLRARQDTGP